MRKAASLFPGFIQFGVCFDLNLTATDAAIAAVNLKNQFSGLVGIKKTYSTLLTGIRLKILDLLLTQFHLHKKISTQVFDGIFSL